MTPPDRLRHRPYSGNGNNISGVPRQRAAPGFLFRAAVTLALAVAALVAAGAGLLTIAPAAQAAETGRLQPASSDASVVIDSVSPQVARPGATVTVSGTATNESGAALSAVSVQLRTSAAPLQSRADMTSYADGTLAADTPVGTAVLVTGSLASGATAHWQLSLSANAIGISLFGVYPLGVQADALGLPVGTDRTFLPFWPGAAASGMSQRLKIAWVWPLLNPPQQGVCPALTSNSLASSVATGGRLQTLLSTGSAYAASADLTWAVDPGLLESVATMTRPYRVGGTADCTGGTAQHASQAAAQWMSGVRAVSSRNQMLTTPYDDVDVAALTHQGLDSDLTSAFQLGRSAAGSLLSTPSGSSAGAGSRTRTEQPSAVSSSIAWPADGLADSSVLANLAINGISTVVLSSSEMPATGIGSDAVASTPTATGTTMKVLLADSAITEVLGSATSAPGSSFAVSQQFLAETAMIASEEPALAQSVVAAPPREWDPSAPLATQLLSDSETANAPWLAPETLAGLAASPPSTSQSSHRPPPDNQVSPAELNGVYLKQVGALDSSMRVYKDILYQPTAQYLSQLSEGVAATESSAWRGSPTANAAGGTMLDEVADYVSSQLRKVQIINSARATLVGSSGTLPVSVVNGLPESIRVRLQATEPPDSRLTIAGQTPPGPITVGAGQTQTAKLSVRSDAIGDTTIELRLLGQDGRPLPEAAVPLSVQSTHFGSTLLILIYAALGVVVLTAIARAIRRALRDDPPSPSQGGQRDGPQHDGQHDYEAERAQHSPTAVDGAATVGRDSEGNPRHPPEAPDDFADARDWARYT